MPSYADEFPLLALFGLYAADIRGDGNCLFNALSDQMYGTQDQHSEIRARVIEYMRSQAAYYKQFLEVYPGGGTRRNPKRKNAGSFTSSAASAPSAADVDRVFEEHVARMAKGGTWGDNMEIQAFAAAYDSNVKIYQRDFAYMIRAPGGDLRPCHHIAYHNWEHYSSIRNLDGPHEGLPNVTPKPLTPAQENEQQMRIATAPPIQQWQINALSKAYPTADTASITRALEESRGVIDEAYEKLMAADEQRSMSSQQSSSVEREQDDDDNSPHGPNKRQDRRLSRASKTFYKIQSDHRHREIGANLGEYDDSLESLVNATSASPATVRPRRRSIDEDASEDEEDWTPDPLNDGDTSSGSEYSTPPPPSRASIKINLSLAKSDSQQSLKASQKPQSPHKRLMSARERKDIKKQAQKQAAKERKQLASGVKKAAAQSTSSSSLDSTSVHPTIATSAMRTLYI